eukprot:scaffold43790_cov38-Cyclotella_meneghiniana.AAC.12
MMKFIDIFCGIIHLPRLIVVLFPSLSTTNTPPVSRLIVVWFVLFLGPPLYLFFGPEVNRWPDPSCVRLYRPLAVAVPKIRHNNDVNTAVDQRRINRGKMVWFLEMKWRCMVAAMVSRWLLVRRGREFHALREKLRKIN